MSGKRSRKPLRMPGRKLWQAVTDAKSAIVPRSAPAPRSPRSSRVTCVPAVEHVARVRGEARPLGRQAHGAAVALEQAAADLALEALDRARQRRRADVAFPAGLQEAQRARQVQEQAERVVIHVACRW